jgi:hypothetical protein
MIYTIIIKHLLNNKYCTLLKRSTAQQFIFGVVFAALVCHDNTTFYAKNW